MCVPRALVLYSSGMQHICDQIKQRREEKQLEDEMKELEKQQTREKQEKMNMEDLKVRRQRLGWGFNTRYATTYLMLWPGVSFLL